MINIFILTLHTATLCSLLLISLRFGKELLCAFLALVAVAMNLFVLKQITLFGLQVTASDALAVGYLLGLNLIQEFFGRKEAKKMIWISFFVCMAFTLLSQLHLAYTPSSHDVMHPFFLLLFRPMPRLMLASLTTFVIVQYVDLMFFELLQKKWSRKYLPLRAALSLLLSQSLDTFLFSFLGLYGLVASIGDVILWSLIIKIFVILCTTPFIFLTKKWVSYGTSI